MWFSEIKKSGGPTIPFLLLLLTVILSYSSANFLQESLNHSPHEPLDISRIKRDAIVQSSRITNGEDDGREEISESPEGLDGVKMTIAPSRVSVKPTMTVTATRIGTTRYFTPPKLSSPSPASPHSQVNNTPETLTETESVQTEKDFTSSPTPLQSSLPLFENPTPGEEEKEDETEDEGSGDNSMPEDSTPPEEKMEGGEGDRKVSSNVVEGEEGDGELEEEGEGTEEEMDEEAQLLSVLGGSRRNFGNEGTWANFSDGGASGVSGRGEGEDMTRLNSTTTAPSQEHNHHGQDHSRRFPLNLQGGKGVDDKGEEEKYDKNGSNILDSITFEENEILESLPLPAHLVGSTTAALFPNETTAILEEDFAQAFNNNGEEGNKRWRRLRGPVRRRVRKMRTRKPDNNATSPTGISSDTFFYPPSEYFTPNINTDRPNSFNQGQYNSQNTATKPNLPSDTRIRMVRRFRSTTTPQPPTNPNDFGMQNPESTTESPQGGGSSTFPRFNPQGGGGGGGGGVVKKPIILLRSPTIPLREENYEEFEEDVSEDESEPQIERPNSFPYTEKSNTFTDDVTNTIMPDVGGQGGKQGGATSPGSTSPSSSPPSSRVHNNETGEWLHSEHSKHHDISHNNEATPLHPYGEDRDQWEQNYMNLQQHSFFSPSSEQGEEETPIITAEDVLGKHHVEGQDHQAESFERTLTKSVAMSDGPDPTHIVQSYNTREPSVTVVEHHHHLPTVTINHPPTYDEGAQILHESFLDNGLKPGLSSSPLPPPPTPPKYLGESSALYGEEKVPSGSFPSEQVEEGSGGSNYFGRIMDKPSPPYSSPSSSSSSGLSPSSSTSMFKPYLSSPDQSAFSQLNNQGKGRTRGSHYDRTRHRYTQHSPPNELFQDKEAYPDTSHSNTRLHSKPSNANPTFTSAGDAKKNLPSPSNLASHPGAGSSIFSSHEFPNHPEGSKTIPGPPPPGFRNPFMPKIADHFNAMRNSIFKESSGSNFGQLPPPQSYSHFSKGPGVDHHDASAGSTKPSSYEIQHAPPTGGDGVGGNSPSSSSFIPGITGSSPFNSLSTYVNEQSSQVKKRPAPVWPGKQSFSNPSGPNRSPKKILEGGPSPSYSHVNPMDSSSNSFRTSSHYGGPGDFSPHHPSFYDASSPNSPKLTLPMPGLVSIPTPPPDSHAMNQVTPNRHFPPHTHSMSSYSDYEPANPPLPSGHALTQHFDHFVQNAGEFKDDDHHGHEGHGHHHHDEEEGEYTELEITKNKSKVKGGKYKNKDGKPSSTFTGKFPESKKNRNKYGNRRKPSKSKDNRDSESERSPGYYSSSSSPSSASSSSGAPSRGKNQYQNLSPPEPDITIITSPDYANDGSSSAMIEFDTPSSYDPTSPYSLPYSDPDYPDHYRYKERPEVDVEDEGKTKFRPSSSRRPPQNNYREGSPSEYDLAQYMSSFHRDEEDETRDGENYSSPHDQAGGGYKYEEESGGGGGEDGNRRPNKPSPTPSPALSSSTKDNDSQGKGNSGKGSGGGTGTEANPELDESVPSPFSETPYVLMFPNTLPTRHHYPRPPLPPPALSLLNQEVPIVSASEHLSPNPEKLLGPGLKAVPVHPRHQMMKVLATKQYLTHLEAIQERQRKQKTPPAIYTPYGVLVPMGLSGGSQPFVPPPNLPGGQTNGYSQLSPASSSPVAAKQSRGGSLDEKSLLSILLGHKSPPNLPVFDSFKSDQTRDLKESVDPALDLLAEKLAIKLSSLEPFTPFRQSTSSTYPLLYMQGTSYSELSPVRTPYKNSTTVKKSKGKSSSLTRPTSQTFSTISSSSPYKHSGNQPPPRADSFSLQQTLKQVTPTLSTSSSSVLAQPKFGVAGESSPALKSILKERLYEMLQESYAEAASSYSQSIAQAQLPSMPTQHLLTQLEASSSDLQKSFIPDNPFSSGRKSARQQGSSSSKLLSSLLNFAGQGSNSGGSKAQSQSKNHQQHHQQLQQLQKKQHRPHFSQPTGILGAIKRLFSFPPTPSNRQDSVNGGSIRKNSNISQPAILPPHPFAPHPAKRVQNPADSPWLGRRSPKKFTHSPPSSSQSSTRGREGGGGGKMGRDQVQFHLMQKGGGDNEVKSRDGLDPQAQAYGFKSVGDMEKMLRYLLKLKPQLETEEKRKYGSSGEHHQHNPLLSSHSPTTLERLIYGKQEGEERLANPPGTFLHFLPSQPFSQETSAASSVSKRSSNAFSSTLNDLSTSASETHSVAILPTPSTNAFLPQKLTSKDLAGSKPSSNVPELSLPYQNHFFPIPTSWKPIPDSVSLPSSSPTKPQDAKHHSSQDPASQEKQEQSQKTPSAP